MRLRLTDDVHGVMIDDDAVFLDVAANAYFCLPAIGSIMRLAGGDIDTTEAVLADSLCAAGLPSTIPPTGIESTWTRLPS